MKVKILYPEERYVSPEQIISWANDELADTGEEPVDDLDEAISVLHDSGSVTIARESSWLHDEREQERDFTRYDDIDDNEQIEVNDDDEENSDDDEIFESNPRSFNWETEEAERYLLNNEEFHNEALRIQEECHSNLAIATGLETLFRENNVMRDSLDDINWRYLARQVSLWSIQEREPNRCRNPKRFNPESTVSFWFDKDKFSKPQATSWARSHGLKTESYSTDGFYAFPQMSEQKERRYRGKIRSKYVAPGILLKFVPVRFMKGR